MFQSFLSTLAAALAAGGHAPAAEAARRRNLLALSLVSFLASVGFMVVMPLLPGLIRESLGQDTTNAGIWLGLALSVAPLLTALTGPVWSVLGERYGHKMMIQRSLVCIGVGIGLLALAWLPLHVVALRAFIGGLGGVSVAALAAATATTPRRELGPAVGAIQAAQTAGSMVGPLLGGILGGLLGMRESFVASALIFAGAILLVQWLYRDDAPRLAEGEVRPSRDGERDSGRIGVGMALALAAAFICHFVEGSLLVLLPLQLEWLGVEPTNLPWVLGLGLSATYLAATVAAAFGGRLARRRSAVSLLCLVVGLGMVALVPLVLAQSWWQFLGGRVVLALVVGAAPTLVYSAAATLAPPARRAKMVSLVSSAGIFGWAASPLIAGALAQVDPTLLLALDGALYALLLVALLVAGGGLVGRIGRPRLSLPSAPPPLPNVGRSGPGREAGARGDLLDRLLPGRAERRYTTGEVVAALHGTVSGPRADAILDVAGRPSTWLPADPGRAFGPAPRYVERLPTILSAVRRGEELETIGRRLSLFGSGQEVQRTVEAAARLIANHLNRR